MLHSVAISSQTLSWKQVLQDSHCHMLTKIPIGWHCKFVAILQRNILSENGKSTVANVCDDDLVVANFLQYWNEYCSQKGDEARELSLEQKRKKHPCTTNEICKTSEEEVTEDEEEMTKERKDFNPLSCTKWMQSYLLQLTSLMHGKWSGNCLYQTLQRRSC